MRPAIVRNLICPLHERLLGRHTFRYLNELERSQWLSPDDLRILQAQKLSRLLRHAHDNIPYYQKLFRDHAINIHDNDPIKSLEQIPFLDKNQIRLSLADMLWKDVPGGLHPFSTGGSSGDPLKFYFDRRRQGYDQAGRIRSHKWFDVNVGDPELYLWGSPIELARSDRVKHLRDKWFNHKLLSAFDMSPQQMDIYLDEWDQFGPVCLFGYPSSIAHFVQHAQERRRILDTHRLRTVFVTGEVCYSHDREMIENYFGVPVADGYGSREAGFIAHECPEKNLHLTAENIIIEIVKDDQPVPVGETGEIVITHLDTYAMPFIRYRTGDVGRLRSGRCACGRGLPMMDVVQGRTTDFLHLPDGNVKHALSIIYPLREIKGLRQFRVTQHEDYSITVDVVRDDRVALITREAVAKQVRPILGKEIPVYVDIVDHIDSNDSGKYRYVISHVNKKTNHPKKEDIDV